MSEQQKPGEAHASPSLCFFPGSIHPSIVGVKEGMDHVQRTPTLFPHTGSGQHEGIHEEDT